MMSCNGGLWCHTTLSSTSYLWKFLGLSFHIWNTVILSTLQALLWGLNEMTNDNTEHNIWHRLKNPIKADSYFYFTFLYLYALLPHSVGASGKKNLLPIHSMSQSDVLWSLLAMMGVPTFAGLLGFFPIIFKEHKTLLHLTHMVTQ